MRPLVSAVRQSVHPFTFLLAVLVFMPVHGLPNGTEEPQAQQESNPAPEKASQRPVRPSAPRLASKMASVKNAPSVDPSSIFVAGPSGNLNGIPQSIAVADVNGDGKPDLIVGETPTVGTLPPGIVAVLLGNGDGTFQAEVDYSSGGSEIATVAVADLNGDGKPDIVVANSTSADGDGLVGVLIGNGDGTFQAAAEYDPGAGEIGSLAVADVNGDGHPDVVIADEYGFAVLLGNGDGTFQAPVQIPVAYENYVVVGDVNGDGYPDVVLADSCPPKGCTPHINVALGNGDGTFQPVSSSYSPAGQGGAIVLADVNGDGFLDLVALNPSGYVGVYLGNGDGTFQAEVSFNAGGSPTSVSVADVNADGYPDVVVAIPCQGNNCTDGGSVSVLLGNGDGTFQNAILFNLGFPYAIALEDVNGDGKPDAVFASYPCYGVSLCLSNDQAVTEQVLLNVSLKSPSQVQLASSLNPANINEPVTLTATVTGQSPTGTVTFNKNGQFFASAPVVNGQAQYTYEFTVASSKEIVATYSGDANNGGSNTLALRQIVMLPGVTSTAVTASPNPATAGQSVTLTATVSGQSLTGQVTFLKNGVTLATVPVVNGQATYTQIYPWANTKSIVAEYSGDSFNQPSTSAALNLIVNPATSTTTLVSSENPANVGDSVTLTATVTSSSGLPVPDDEFVTFFDNGTMIATVPTVNGQASCTFAFEFAGTKQITATYAGDVTNSPSTSAVLSEVVN